MRLSIYAQNIRTGRKPHALPARVRNRYDAARFYQGPDRSTIWSPLQDARYDLPPADRMEMLRKIIYFEQNCDIVQKILDVFETYTVGPHGLVMTPASSDPDWNGQCKIFWDEFSREPDRSSNQSLPDLEQLSARLLFSHGECFILKTRRPEPPFLPRLQLLEATRINTPSDRARDEGTSIIDGAEIDARGKPTHYWVADGLDPNSYRRVPAWAVIPVQDLPRPGLVRSPTPFYAALNTLHDLDDLQRMEMKVAKDQSDDSKIIKTKDGELDGSEEWDSDETSDAGAENPAYEYYRKVFGPSAKVMRIGDEIDKSGPERPTIFQQWYFRHLNEKVCGAVGVPLSMIYPESMQGTSLRAVFDQANGMFRSKSAILAAAWREAREYVISEGSRFDSRIARLPEDWRKSNVRAPRAVNVDVGRNADAMLKELRAGTRTFQDVCAELGYDWREVLEQRAAEIAFIKSLESKYGVDAAEITDVLKGASNASQTMVRS